MTVIPFGQSRIFRMDDNTLMVLVELQHMESPNLHICRGTVAGGGVRLDNGRFIGASSKVAPEYLVHSTTISGGSACSNAEQKQGDTKGICTGSLFPEYTPESSSKYSC
jgi:hypothetical protein